MCRSSCSSSRSSCGKRRSYLLSELLNCRMRPRACSTYCMRRLSLLRPTTPTMRMLPKTIISTVMSNLIKPSPRSARPPQKSWRFLLCCFPRRRRPMAACHACRARRTASSAIESDPVSTAATAVALLPNQVPEMEYLRRRSV